MEQGHISLPSFLTCSNDEYLRSSSNFIAFLEELTRLKTLQEKLLITLPTM